MTKNLLIPSLVWLLLSIPFFKGNLNAQCGAEIVASTPELCTNDVAFLIASYTAGDGGSLSYIWNTGETTESIYTPVSGEYTVTITDDSNCTASATYYLFDAPYLEAVISASATELTCYNPFVTLDGSNSISGSGNISYYWSTGEITSSIEVYQEGNYSLEIIDNNNGCYSITTIDIVGNTNQPIAIINSPNNLLTCNEPTVVLDASNSVSGGQTALEYQWSTGDNTPTIFVSSAGEYTVTVVDNSNGCIDMASAIVVEDVTPPVVDIYPSSPEICPNDVVVLYTNVSGSGGSFSYEWNTSETAFEIYVVTSGEYIVTVTDESNGCTATASYFLFEAPYLEAIIDASSTELNCSNANVTLDGSGSFQGSGSIYYYWSTGETTPSIIVSEGGAYSLEIIDDYNGCYSYTTINITENTAFPVINLTASSTEINSQNPTVLLDASSSTGQGTLSYLWSDNSTASTLTVSVAGDYAVTVIDSDNDCSSMASITITENLIDLYVDHTATGTSDGSSWANAFTDLQDALVVGGTIHIAKGTYYPTSGTVRGIAFEPSSNTAILGGYPNGGGTRSSASNETILSGNIDGVASYAGNSFHVVSVKNANNVTLDGLTIRDGNADNTNSFGRSRGAGLFVNNATLTVKDTEVKWNKAIYGAGIFATLSPNVTLEDCTFKKNTADTGSAIYHSNQTNLYVNRTRIIDNNSLVRCAVEVNNSLYTKIENSVIADNASGNANAIAFIATNRDGSCDIYNTTILGETQNKSLIVMQVGFGDQLDVSLYNSIVSHQNPAFSQIFKAFNNGVLNLNTRNCYIMGSTVMGNANNNLYSATAGNLILNANYSLDPCSPGVDDGDDGYVVGSTDIDGVIRIINTVDMGAYENAFACRLATAKKETAISDISIFPNPTKDRITIQGELKNPTFRLFDLLGKEVLNTKSREISLTQFPQGIYILKVMEGKKMIDSIKVVKK